MFQYSAAGDVVAVGTISSWYLAVAVLSAPPMSWATA